MSDKFRCRSVCFIPFGQVSAVPNGNCRPGVSKGKEDFGFWDHPHPSQATGIKEKKIQGSFHGFGSDLLWTQLEGTLVPTLLRHHGRAFKYKACEKWQIRIGQISPLLKDKDTVFARRTPKINLVLQIIHKKYLG